MSRVVVALAAAATAAAAASVCQAATPMRPGMWEITFRMGPGTAPITSRTCVTAKDVEAMNRGRGANKGAENCEPVNYKQEGNKATWSLACKGRTPMTGTGSIEFGSDTFTQKMVMKSDGGTMTMESTGKRVGECK
jgi:Protein of unknown function (DUF3617)